MKRINVKNFNQEIAKDRLTAVVFTSKNCPPCDTMKESIKNVESLFKVSFLEFYKGQINSKEIEEKYNIKMVPRTVFFKSGKEVGRLFLDKTPKKLVTFLDRLMQFGSIPYDPSDAEEVSYFYTKVLKVLGWDFHEFDRDEWGKKGQELMELAHRIIEHNSGWRFMSDDDIKIAAK